MKYRDLVSSLFWMGIGVTFCLGALRYGLFVSGTPGSGLFPFIAGMALIVLSLMILVSSLKQEKPEVLQREPFFPKRDSWKKLSLTLFALLAYWIAVEYLGFLLTTFLFMIFLLRFIEPQRWVTVVATSFLTANLSNLFFQVWLRVQLPSGILRM
jgi:putative tricarboxylic transport membrane protein